MNGIIGRISWDGCGDCKNYDDEGYTEGCTEEINMSDLEIDMETDDVVCKLWKERGAK